MGLGTPLIPRGRSRTKYRQRLVLEKSHHRLVLTDSGPWATEKSCEGYNEARRFRAPRWVNRSVSDSSRDAGGLVCSQKDRRRLENGCDLRARFKDRCSFGEREIDSGLGRPAEMSQRYILPCLRRHQAGTTFSRNFFGNSRRVTVGKGNYIGRVVAASACPQWFSTHLGRRGTVYIR